VALGDLYVSLAEQKGYLGVTDTVDDTILTSALIAACAGVNDVCGRQFNDAGVTSARLFKPRSSDVCMVDDFSTSVGLVIATDLDGDGVFEQTWTGTDFELEPLNGIRNGVPGWPYNQINAFSSLYFPSSAGRRGGLYASPWRYARRDRASVQVIARWGWAAIPEPVKQTVKITASEISKLKDAPFGVAGFDQYGAVRVRANPIAMWLLGPYVVESHMMR